MRVLIAAVLVLCCTRSLPAADFLSVSDTPRTVAVNARDRFLSQLVDGAGWSTTIIVINMESKPLNFGLNFWDNTGRSMVLAIQDLGSGTGILGTLPAGQSRIFTTTGTAADLKEGWANLVTFDRPGGSEAGAVLTNDLIGGAGIFTQRIAGRPDNEASVLVERPTQRVIIPFDNRNNFSSAIALVNPDATQTLSIEGRNSLGTVLFTDSVNVTSGQKLVFSVPTRYPVSSGATGVIQITGSGAVGITALGLRFNPTGAFTSTPALVPTP